MNLIVYLSTGSIMNFKSQRKGLAIWINYFKFSLVSEKPAFLQTL